MSGGGGGDGPVDAAGRRVALAVVLPCFNVADTLAAQLDALVHERWHRPWTIVVVDNASTDPTASVAARYRAVGVTVVPAFEGRGVGHARNVGAAAVASDALVFCDGDDLIAPGWVAAMGDALASNALVGGAVDTALLNPAWLAGSRPMASGEGLARFGTTAFAPGCSFGIDRGLYDRLGGFDEGFAGLEDIELALRARAAGVVAVPAPGATVHYRLRTDPRQIWRQGRFYGAGRPLLVRRARELGLPAPSRFDGVRSWAWLVWHLPEARHRAGRYRLLWVLAFRSGVLRRAVQLRRPYL